MREWLARLIDWRRRDVLDDELAEELRFHRRQAERDAAAGGAADDEASRIAARRLGNLTRAHEDARARWSIPWLDHLQQDMRYALRGLRRSPAFTATVVVTLALGIGANAAMFDVVDRLMFRPLALLRDPGTVHRVYVQWTDRQRQTTTTWTSYERYRDLQTGTSSFAQFAAFSDRLMLIGAGEPAREHRIAAVTASYFDFFDARPTLGRFFTAAEDQPPQGAAVAVLSHGYWQSAYGGRAVLGDTIQIGDVAATIIGVAPPGFSGVNDADPAAVFIPLTTLGGAIGGQGAATFSTGYASLWGHVMVRRKPGIPAAQASADLTNALRRSWETQRAGQTATQLRLPDVEAAQPRAVVSALRLGGGPDPSLEARTARWVAGVAALVLLIASANVANLLLGRAVARQRETAVRLALGVSRWRLLSQAITESVVLALIGAVGGLLLAQWGRVAIGGLLIPNPEIGSIVDGRTLGATLAIAMTLGLLTGVAPALLARRSDFAPAMKGGARSGTARGGRVRTTLVVVQAALSVVLLVGAVLFVRSLMAVQAMPMGYDADRVLIVDRVLRGPRLQPAERAALRRRLLEAAQQLPGVEYASWKLSQPLGSQATLLFSVPGVDTALQPADFSAQVITTDYFRVLGTRVLRGRSFSADDRPNTPAVVIISESMAAALWPSRDAIGECLRFGPETAPCTTIVGVVEDVVHSSITAANRRQYYLPFDQAPIDGTGLLLRLRGDPAVEGESIRRALQPLMPGTSYLTVQPMAGLVDRARRSWRLGATMFVAFGVLALVVAAVGLYGVIGYTVAQRMQELSVRVALGARRGDVVWLVVKPSVMFALAGAVLGCVAALGASRWLQPLLFNQSATDPIVYVVVAMTMLLVALVASAAPAAQAAQADPNAALRAD